MAALLVKLLLLVMMELAAGQEYCSSRGLDGTSPGTESQPRETCPYLLEVESGWIPGSPILMQLSGRELETETDLKLFLVSMQLGSSLIGEMVTSDDQVTTTCQNTSVRESNSTAVKELVEFSWIAPKDLGKDEQVIVRYSAALNAETFWTDCDAFLLGRDEDFSDEEDQAEDAGSATPAPSTVLSSTRPASTKAIRVASADVADGSQPTATTASSTDGTTPAAPSTAAPSNTSCTQNGIQYEVMPNEDCKVFMMKWSGREEEIQCPEHTQFSIDKCACSHSSNVDCDI